MHGPAPTRCGLSRAATALLLVAAAATAQTPCPHLGYVFPAGGPRGGTFRIAIGGQQLGDATNALVSGGGIKVGFVEVVRTLTGRQRAALSRTLAILEQARPTVEIVDEIAEIRRKLAAPGASGAAMADTMVFEVAVARDAETGPRELRLATGSALSNPLVFRIGSLPEVIEGAMPEVSLDVEVLRALGAPIPLPGPQASGPVAVKLPVVVNGRILPGSTDQYRFEARRGQRIVIAVEARDLIPYIADAVPGWFAAAVSVRDARGRELAYADHFGFRADPSLCVEMPDDGTYTVDIRDTLYRGREDFVYRMALGEIPVVTGVYPMGCRAGARTKIAVTGWNLPAGPVVGDTAGLAPGVHLLWPLKDRLACNRVLFDVGEAPDIEEARTHASRADAQAIALPVVVNGRIDPPGQWDVFRFEGRAGQDVVAEVHARRLGSPLDSVLMLTDTGGTRVAVNDDCGDNREAGLETHHADSSLSAHLPAAGTYYLHLGDTQQHGGPEYAYRLQVRAPKPDFELRVAPSAVNLTPGEHTPVSVYAVRKDGFAGDIELSLKDAPRGLILSGGRMGATADRTVVTLAALPAAPRGRVALRLEGRAAVGGQEVVREAVPTEDMMQAFLWRHLVPAGDLSATVAAGGAPRRPIRFAGNLPVAVPAGGSNSVRVDLDVPGGSDVGPVQFELVDPPQGVSVRSAEPDGQHAQMVLSCDPEKLKPGFKGNLIAVAFVMVTPPPSSPAPASQAPGARRPDRAERMRILKELPALSDGVGPEFTRHDPELDRWFTDSGPAMEKAEAAPAKPEPLPPGRPPAQRLTLGTLPALAFEVAKP
jgi:hypothetical protein